MHTAAPDSIRPSCDMRRFSCGERQSLTAHGPIWKFDAWVALGQCPRTQTICYVQISERALALRAVFEQCPGATIYGTGLPLTGEQLFFETGRRLGDGEVLLVD